MQNNELKKVVDAAKRFPVTVEGSITIHISKERSFVSSDMLTREDSDNISKHLQNKYNESQQLNTRMISKKEE